MKSENQCNLLILSLGNEERGQKDNGLKKSITLLLLCLLYMPLYAQYTGNLPSLGQPYDYDRAANGQVFEVDYGGTLPKDRAMWSIKIAGEERLRVCRNGTLALLGEYNSYPTFNFYTSNKYFLGSINAKGENLNLVGYRAIGIYPRQIPTATIMFDRGETRSNVALNFYNENLNYLNVKSGRNQDAAIINPAAKWLRIGSKSGVAFWGNENADNDDSPHFKILGTEVYSYVPIKMMRNNVTMVFSTDEMNSAGWLGTSTNNGLCLGTNSTSLFFIDNIQNVYIGMSKQEANKIKQDLRNKYRLFVTKGILSEDFAIAPKSTWADYVFNKDYNLRGLNEVEEFISENNHLPDVPSAKQVADEGYSQHDMNKALLQKIEELTLYVIKQEKKIATLESELENLKK